MRNEEFDSLEAELKALQLVEPSANLQARIETKLAVPKKTRVWYAAAIALPIAAAIAWLVALPRPQTAKPNSPAANTSSVVTRDDVLKPIAAENVLYSAADEGIITLADGTPARRERLRYVDEITWQNPKTHASLTWTIPREEVRLVPVSYQ